MEEKFVIGACTAKKKILVMMAVQSILLIPFKVTLQALECRRRW